MNNEPTATKADDSRLRKHLEEIRDCYIEKVYFQESVPPQDWRQALEGYTLQFGESLILELVTYLLKEYPNNFESDRFANDTAPTENDDSRLRQRLEQMRDFYKEKANADTPTPPANWNEALEAYALRFGTNLLVEMLTLLLKQETDYELIESESGTVHEQEPQSSRDVWVRSAVHKS